MSKQWWLLFIATILSVWNAGIVWFTQIAVYPLWPLVGADKFHDYHLTWWHDMWPSFGPVVLMFACAVALLWIRPQGIPVWSLWLGVLLQAAVHTLTAFFWAPIQATMATPDGMSLAKYQALMDTHWFRVAFFLSYAMLMIWSFSSYPITPSGVGREKDSAASTPPGDRSSLVLRAADESFPDFSRLPVID
jgi:hypothetical protein